MVNDSDDIINDETLFTGIYEFLLREVPFPESNLLLPKESLVSFGFEYTHQWVVSLYMKDRKVAMTATLTGVRS